MIKNYLNKKKVFITMLIICFIILLTLAIAISLTSNQENSIISKVEQAIKAQTESKIKDKLIAAIQKLQETKNGKANFNDITQKWIDSELGEYENKLVEDPSTNTIRIEIRKDDIKKYYIIDENLNVTEKETIVGNIEFLYDVGKRIEKQVEILIYAQDKENGLSKIELVNEQLIINLNNTKEMKALDYKVELGKEYKIKITSGNGDIREENILLEHYWHKVTKTIGEGINSENTVIRTEYNKPYQTILSTEGDYIVQTLTTTMAGKNVTVQEDAATGTVDIGLVTGDIVINATSKLLQISTSSPIIATSAGSNWSSGEGSVTVGTPVYIRFTTSINISGGTCTVDKTIPYVVYRNDIYEFTITGKYKNKTITKEIEIEVFTFVYESIAGLVKYDAGEWTEEEIAELKSKGMYSITSASYKFGGFTHANDTENKDGIEAGTVVTNRNYSATNRGGKPENDGWYILNSYEENGKKYVTKLIHAGSPEFFQVTYKDNTSAASNILTNIRDWSIYKDKDLYEKGYIDKIYLLTVSEAAATSQEMRKIGAPYELPSFSVPGGWTGHINPDGSFAGYYGGWAMYWGIRPVVRLTRGVYIESGDGTAENPYVLGKE